MARGGIEAQWRSHHPLLKPALQGIEAEQLWWNLNFSDLDCWEEEVMSVMSRTIRPVTRCRCRGEEEDMGLW